MNAEGPHRDDKRKGQDQLPQFATLLVGVPFLPNRNAAEGRHPEENGAGDFEPQPVQNPSHISEGLPGVLEEQGHDDRQSGDSVLNGILFAT